MFQPTQLSSFMHEDTALNSWLGMAGWSNNPASSLECNMVLAVSVNGRICLQVFAVVILTFPRLQNCRNGLINARHSHHDAEQMDLIAAHPHHKGHKAYVLQLPSCSAE